MTIARCLDVIENWFDEKLLTNYRSTHVVNQHRCRNSRYLWLNYEWFVIHEINLSNQFENSHHFAHRNSHSISNRFFFSHAKFFFSKFLKTSYNLQFMLKHIFRFISIIMWRHWRVLIENFNNKAFCRFNCLSKRSKN